MKKFMSSPQGVGTCTEERLFEEAKLATLLRSNFLTDAGGNERNIGASLRKGSQIETAGCGLALLVQLLVFRFGLLQDRNIRVGILPEVKEILVGGFRPGCIAGHRISASDLKMSQ